MNILRFLIRIFYKTKFHICNHQVELRGKGIIKNASCSNFGNDNIIFIEAGASLENCKIYFKGNKNNIQVSCGTHLQNVTFWFEDDNNKIEIGQQVTSEGNLELAACESKSIIIGDDCMFSYGLHIRTTDSHSIVNDKGIRINKGANITIGNHVWIGADVMILKGSIIPDNCVVGAKSMVTSSLKACTNDLITGIPARVIKENINWKRERI